MGISYIVVVLPRLTRGKCLKVDQEVMLKMVLGDLLGDLLREKEGKRREDRKHEQEEEQSNLGVGSYQTHRTISGALGRERIDGRDEELEHLRRLVKDLELEARGRRRRRDHVECAEGSASVGGCYGEGFHQSDSH